jgi:hypothetical protein
MPRAKYDASMDVRVRRQDLGIAGACQRFCGAVNVYRCSMIDSGKDLSTGNKSTIGDCLVRDLRNRIKV